MEITIDNPIVDNLETGVIGRTENTVILKKEFFERLKETVEPYQLPDRNIVTQISSSQTSYQNLMRRLNDAKREDTRVKEVVLQTEVNIPETMETMKSAYDQEVRETLVRIQNHYDSKIQALEELYRHNVVGKRLLSLINAVSAIGWHLVLKENSFNLVKLYSPAKEITVGMKTDLGEKWIYERPFVTLKAIYVNMLHSRIEPTTIHISTVGQHPNAQYANFSEVCSGTLGGRSIKLDDTEELIVLLNEISRTYEVAHLESAFYVPTIPILQKERIREAQWITRVATT